MPLKTVRSIVLLISETLNGMTQNIEEILLDLIKFNKEIKYLREENEILRKKIQLLEK